LINFMEENNKIEKVKLLRQDNNRVPYDIIKQALLASNAILQLASKEKLSIDKQLSLVEPEIFLHLIISPKILPQKNKK